MNNSGCKKFISITIVLAALGATMVPVQAQTNQLPSDEERLESDITASDDASNLIQTRSSIVLESTSVTGSRELPKVLVIVPWKTSESMGPGERPLASLVEDALTPLDPDVFRRRLNYYSGLQSAGEDAAGKNTTMRTGKDSRGSSPKTLRFDSARPDGSSSDAQNPIESRSLDTSGQAPQPGNE